MILAFVAMLSVFNSCYDDTKIWEAIEEIKSKISTLITVVEGSDGEYYWAVCGNGTPTPLQIDGKKVPVTVLPALKISADNMWMISVDGGATWVNTGIKYEGQNADTETIFFNDVKKEGDYLILTLADGNVVKISIVGDAVFTASADTLWFSRTGMEKSVAVEMSGVKAYTITEKPEGWKATMDDSYIYVTSPESFTEYKTQGTVKVLAVFENGQSPAILSLDVMYEPMFALSFVNGKVSVALSEKTGEDFNGYVLAGWKKADFTVEKAVAWLNSEVGSIVPFEGTAEYDLSEVISGYSESEDYVVFAAPYLPANQVTQGKMKYESGDVSHVSVKSMSNWKFTNVRFDSADLTAEMEAPFFGGFFKLADWNNYGRDNFLETLKMDEIEPYTMTSYNGPANAFPNGEVDMNIHPATEYVVWYIAEKTSGSYEADDFVTYTFKTPDVSYNSAIAAPSFVTKNSKPSGFTAEVTPASNVYKTYAAVVRSGVIPETDIELVRYLIGTDQYSSGSAVNTVSNYSVSADDDVYVVAVSVSENGEYGNILKQQVEVEDVTFTDALSVTVTDISYGLGDVTLGLEYTGNVEKITYLAASYTYYTDDVLERLLALGQMGDATSVEIEKLGGQLHLTGLTLGAEYTFYAVVSDADGNFSHMYTYNFVPTNSVDYILSDSADYEYGMPQLSGTCTGSANSYTLNLNVEMPSTCVKYWLFKGNYEYFTGDPWTDSDKLVTEQFMDVTVHTESIYDVKYTYMNSTSRIYMVWQDNKGGFHAIYEYNPKK